MFLYQLLGLGGRVVRGNNMRGKPPEEVDDNFHVELLFIGIGLPTFLFLLYLLC